MLTRERDRSGGFLLGGPSDADLQKICVALNNEAHPRRAQYLRQFVGQWRDSGPNLQKMLDDDEQLRLALEDAWRVRFFALPGPRAVLLLLPSRPQNTDYEYAVGMFAALTLNPDCERLAGPCGYEACGKYFIQKRRRRVLYCSRQCNQRWAALQCTKRRQLKERMAKLARAHIAIAEWQRTRTRATWKVFVCKHCPEITPNFLTRAVNQGELTEPIRGPVAN